MPWNVIQYDPGHNFDTVTHSYTAPIDGYYLLSLTMRSTPQSKAPYGELHVDGRYLFFCGSDFHSSYSQDSCTWSILIQKGEKVQTKTHSYPFTLLAEGVIQSVFTGHLLYPV